MQRATALALADRRSALESELDELRQSLDRAGVGLNGSLTPGGFPRNDIDIHSVIEMRALYRRKENDLRKLMDEMYNALQQVFKPSTDNTSNNPNP